MQVFETLRYDRYLALLSLNITVGFNGSSLPVLIIQQASRDPFSEHARLIYLSRQSAEQRDVITPLQQL